MTAAAWSAVFLDRDGTINRAPDPIRRYVCRVDELELLPGAAEAIRRLNDSGIWVGVVTNQRGVSLGHMTAADLDAIHDQLRSDLARHGAHLDAIYVCPHPDTSCGCRKPEPGMVNRAFAEHPQLVRFRSVLVGDQDSDMRCAELAGVTGIRISHPDSKSGRERGRDVVVGSLAEAVDGIVSTEVVR
jgi:D-glycero-D-manno-heptose 1,7-bisphosphate phosphatase